MRVSAILVATAAGRVVTVATQIAVAQFLLPQEMGAFVMAMAIVNTTSLFQPGDLPRVALQSREDFLPSLSTIRTYLLLGAACICAAMLLGAPRLATQVDPRLLWLLACIPLLRVICNARVTLLSSLGRTKALAFVSATENLTRGLVLTVLAVLGFGGWALALAEFAAVACSTTCAVKLAPPLPAIRHVLPRLMWRKLASSMGTSQIVSMDKELYPIILGFAMGAATVGSFAFASRVAGQMSILFFPIVVLEMVPAFVRTIHTHGDIGSVYRTELKRLLPGVIVVALIVAIAVPIALLILWPDKWRLAAYLIPGLAIAAAVRLLNATQRAELEAHGAMGKLLSLTVLEVACTALALLAGAAGGSPLLSAFLLIPASCVVWLSTRRAVLGQRTARG